MVGADAAGGDDHHRGAQLEVTDDGTRTGLAPGRVARLQDRAPDTADGAAGTHHLIDAVPEPERHPAAGHRRPYPLLERLDDGRARAPGDMEARYGVAVAVRQTAAALGPADDREPAHPLLVEPGPLLPGGEVHIGFRPLVRPVVLPTGIGGAPVEAGRALPVLPRQLTGVLDPHQPLLGRVDQEQPAERPERLPAQIGLRLLVEEQHLAPGVHEFRRRDQPGQPAADDDHIGVRRLGRVRRGDLGEGGGAGEYAARHRERAATAEQGRICGLFHRVAFRKGVRRVPSREQRCYRAVAHISSGRHRAVVGAGSQRGGPLVVRRAQRANGSGGSPGPDGDGEGRGA